MNSVSYRNKKLIIKMTNTFPELPYAYDALEPYIDEETMKIHHDKHHKAYFDKFTAAIENSEIKDKDVKEILSDLNSIPSEIKTAVVNNGGGYFNHSFFWEILSKDKPFREDSEIGKEIVNKFESFDKFKEQFSNAAATQFGSGWAWLVLNNDSKELGIIKTSNQDSPISQDKTPLIGIDVWEHAYYLKYQNQRPKYIEAFFSVINWDKVNELFSQAKH